jgi:hypothetical protein
MVIDAPIAPEVWLRLVMAGITVNDEPLLACPPTVTTTLPVVAAAGTVTTMLVALQVVTVAAVPLNVTVLEPCDDPKVVPVMVIDAPTAPEVALRLVMAGITVNGDPLLAAPNTLTTTLPVVAAAGTATVMLVALQALAAAAVPLKVTVLVPCEAPKFVPVMVIDAPTAPEVALRLVMAGGGMTVKGEPLLAVPNTVTTTLPVVAPVGTFTTMLVALQLVAVPVAVPLKVTVLVP